MKLSIMQPAFFPWLGYFKRILDSDRHIVLDHVQMDKSSKTNFANRNRIMTSNGPHWLSVPVNRKSDLRLDHIEISKNEKWEKKQLSTIEMSYSKAPHFKDYIGFFRELYSQEFTRLADLIDASNKFFLEALEIQVPISKSSSLELLKTKDELILEICLQQKASTYISGPFGRDYLKEDLFSERDIQLKFHEFDHPVYRQMSSEFQSNLSVLDLLMNEGPKSAEILRACSSRLVS